MCEMVPTMSEKNSPTNKYHPSVEHLLRFFAYKHLPDHLQGVSSQFFELAVSLAKELPENQEATTCLRKLLESKDCAVRAALCP